MKAAGQALSHVPLDQAICSGVPHTRQTAEMFLPRKRARHPLWIWWMSLSRFTGDLSVRQ
ncbi:hypothetical protein [Parvibaculum sp.]|uniref:hypothetical protein n=1 Tax=Parvibaculum sp. TaxID=2024848 RepID=UPI0034507A2D